MSLLMEYKRLMGHGPPATDVANFMDDMKDFLKAKQGNREEEFRNTNPKREDGGETLVFSTMDLCDGIYYNGSSDVSVSWKELESLFHTFKEEGIEFDFSNEELRGYFKML